MGSIESFWIGREKQRELVEKKKGREGVREELTVGVRPGESK